MAGTSRLTPEVRYRGDGEDWVRADLADVDGSQVVRGAPVRSFPTYPAQRNYPGLLWMATTGALVGYESLLERDRLVLADFDSSVRWICSQPFWLSGRDGADLRRHVPDFMLETVDGFVVVDVKPAELIDRPVVAETFQWTAGLCAAKGWRYEVWSGGDPVLLRNLRFLSPGRRSHLYDPVTLDTVAGAGKPGSTLAQAEAESGIEPPVARAAVHHLLWSHRWQVELSRPLSGSSVLEKVA